MEVKGLLMFKFCIFSETGYWNHTCEIICPRELEKVILSAMCHVPVQINMHDPHTTSLAEISIPVPCDHAHSLWLF